MAAGQPVGSIFVSGSHHRELVFGQQVQQASLVISEIRERKRQLELKAARKEASSQQAASTARDVSRPQSGAGSAKVPKRNTSVTLKELIEEGVVRPGEGNVTVEVKEKVIRADLLESGQIEYGGARVDSPGQFYARLKGLTELPDSKDGEDNSNTYGWHMVHVDGKSLEDYRQKYNPPAQGASQQAKSPPPDPYQPSVWETQLPEGQLPVLPSLGDDKLPKIDLNPKPAKSSRSRQRAEARERERGEPGAAPGGVNTNTVALTQNLAAIIANASQFIGGQAGASLQQAAQQIKQEAIKQEAIVKQEVGATGAEEAEANWVQCSRCETWRMVPEQWWPQIQATGDEDWFCEMATWDITKFDPFTAACPRR